MGLQNSIVSINLLAKYPYVFWEKILLDSKPWARPTRSSKSAVLGGGGGVGRGDFTVICLNVRFLTVQKATSLKFTFLNNVYSGDLDKYITGKMFFRHRCALLDKVSRSYEQKN